MSSGRRPALAVIAQAQMAEPITKHMAVLVEDGLEVAADRVPHNIAPVATLAVVDVRLL